MAGTALRIMVVGLRGIPDVPGGIETHAAQLYPRLATLGAKVMVLGRQQFRPREVGTQWHGVRLCWLWSPRRRGFEAAVHTVLGVLYAGIRRPDILHIHAVGPSITIPLAKLLGLRVVVTHHGQDYLREKWNTVERSIIRLGERFAVRLSDALITVSSSVGAGILARYGRETIWIPNGVASIPTATGYGLLERYGLARGRYVMQIGRMVPEKRQLDLIAAFRAAGLADWKLLLVGGSHEADEYAASVLRSAAQDATVICTGSLEGAKTHELLAGAGLFVLPSAHEGFPIALLEAVAHGVPSLASDIPGNREVGLQPDCYFGVGHIEGLALRLRELANCDAARIAAVSGYRDICRRFDWNLIAAETLSVMESVAIGRGRRVRQGPQQPASAQLTASSAQSRPVP